MIYEFFLQVSTASDQILVDAVQTSRFVSFRLIGRSGVVIILSLMSISSSFAISILNFLTNYGGEWRISNGIEYG